MPRVNTDIPELLRIARDAEISRLHTDESAVVTAGIPRPHAIPGVYLPPGRLVAGVSDKEVSVSSILEHGAFGLGTFANLNGALVILDGCAFQALGTGKVCEAAGDPLFPPSPG